MPRRAKFHFDKMYYLPETKPTGRYIIGQIGDLNCEPGYVVGSHVQELHEISYIVSGKGDFYLNHKCYKVKRGDLIINRIGEEHDIISSLDDPLRYMYLGFQFTEPIESEEIRLLEKFFHKPGKDYCSGAFELQETFVRLLNEWIAVDSFSNFMKECCVTELLCQSYRMLNAAQKKGYVLRTGSQVDVKALVYDIAHYIDTNIGFLKNLSVLSNVFGYSYAYLSQIFSEEMGETLHEYYTKRRLGKAREYILNGISITETAQLVGFQSIHAFSRAFKKYFGQSPRDMLVE